MPLVSGYNADSQTIHNGAPVAGQFSRLQLDRVIRAGGNILAAGLAKSGATVRGVVNVYTEGVVDLENWNKVTGTQYLTVGQTYRLSSQFGKLTTTGTGQLIGLAVSRQQLSLQIGLGSTGTTSTSVSTVGLVALANLASETAARIAGDNALNTAIAAEIIARIAGDESLQDQITLLKNQANGSYPIPSGVESGSVTGLGLSFIPTKALTGVRKVAGGLNLFACVTGVPTSDGFDFELSGLTDSADYILEYMLV